MCMGQRATRDWGVKYGREGLAVGPGDKGARQEGPVATKVRRKESEAAQVKEGGLGKKKKTMMRKEEDQPVS